MAKNKRPQFTPTGPQSGEFANLQGAREYAQMVTAARSAVVFKGVEHLGEAMITSEKTDREQAAALASRQNPTREDDPLTLDIRGSEGLAQAYARERAVSAVNYAIDNGTGAPVL